MDLTRAAEILMWPLADLDELQLSLRWPVWRVVFWFGLMAWRDGEFDRDVAGERDQERRLEELARKLGAAREWSSC
jgi:hypothetical protein